MGELTEQVRHLPAVQKGFEDELTLLNTNASDLKEQATRAVIMDNKLFAKGGDLVSAIRSQEAQSEVLRKSVTGPISTLVKLINAGFKHGKDIRSEARQLIESKMVVWKQAEELRLRKEAAEAARKLEEDALERAASAATEEDADAVLDAAAEAAVAQEDHTKIGIQRGDFGASTGTRVTYSAKITNLADFLHGVHRWKGTVHPSSIIELKKSGLNTLAKAMIDNGFDFPGVEASKGDKLNIR